MVSNKITGRAKKYNGTAIDYVSIFKWSDGKCIAQVIPDSSGIWEYVYPRNENIGITYVANGCEPITHGAYEITVNSSAHKWWRISNIVNRFNSKPNYSFSIARIIFVNSNGAATSNPSRAFAASAYNNLADYRADKAFDGNANTFANSDIDKNGVLNWFIGYQFDEPVVVEEIRLQARPDLAITHGQEWQTADIEVSDNGVDWVKYGSINPQTAALNNSLITTTVLIDG